MTRTLVLGLFAAQAVVELLARLYPFRFDGSCGFAAVILSLASGACVEEDYGEPCAVIPPFAGRGDTEPLLGLQALVKSVPQDDL